MNQINESKVGNKMPPFILYLSKSIQVFCKYPSCANCFFCCTRMLSATTITCQTNLTNNEINTEEPDKIDFVSSQYQNNLTVPFKPIFPEVVNDVEPIVNKRLQYRESSLKAAGHLVNSFASMERLGRFWDDTVGLHAFSEKRINWFNERLMKEGGPEWNLCYLVLRIGGAFKLVSDDRWIENHRHIRTPSNKDCTVQAVDLRNSCLNFTGMRYFDQAGYIKYLNVADSILFDDYCLTRCHSLAHSLEYLDISGTAVTPGSFSILRIFTQLRWLNLSRLENSERIEAMLPFLQEILPRDCVIVVDDKLPALNFGSEIPFRHWDPTKDVVLEKNPGIGDINAFFAEHKVNPLEVSDVSAIHKLWKTPIVSNRRRKLLEATHPRQNSPMMKVLEQVVNRRDYGQPLF